MQGKHGEMNKTSKKNMKPRRIVLREEYCIGCRLCEVHCITQHSMSRNIIKAYRGTEPRPESGIYFEESGPVSFALQCRHCDDPPCLYSCLTGALYRDRKSGQVLYNKDKCVGCWMCIMSCPLGAIKPDFKNQRAGSKCDLCLEAEFPACVANCPNEAIILLDENGQRMLKNDD